MAGGSGSVFGIASVVGPALGELLTNGPGRRWVFYVNIPVGVLAIAVLLYGLPALRPSESPPSTGWARRRLLPGRSSPR